MVLLKIIKKRIKIIELNGIDIGELVKYNTIYAVKYTEYLFYSLCSPLIRQENIALFEEWYKKEYKDEYKKIFKEYKQEKEIKFINWYINTYENDYETKNKLFKEWYEKNQQPHYNEHETMFNQIVFNNRQNTNIIDKIINI